MGKKQPAGKQARLTRYEIWILSGHCSGPIEVNRSFLVTLMQCVGLGRSEDFIWEIPLLIVWFHLPLQSNIALLKPVWGSGDKRTAPKHLKTSCAYWSQYSKTFKLAQIKKKKKNSIPFWALCQLQRDCQCGNQNFHSNSTKSWSQWCLKDYLN